jgi:RimJ/RimL family protein N-acetyltransferase
LSWRNQEHIRSWFNNTEIITEINHYAWFENYRELDNDFVFVILAKDLDNIRIGQISLYRIDWNTGNAEFGRLIIGYRLARGKGYAKEATRLLLKYGFTQMGLKKIFLEVKEKNKPAIAIYKTVGFVELRKKNGMLQMIIDNKSF